MAILNRKSLVIFFVMMFLSINVDVVSAITIRATSHTTGMVDLVIHGGSSPYDIYVSTDKENYDYVGSYNNEQITINGLENGVTYWFKVEDSTGLVEVSPYTAPFLNIEMYPLRVVDLGESQVHVQWSPYFDRVNILLDGSTVATWIDSCEYTVNELEPGTMYTLQLVNEFGVNSNKITFRTRDDLSKLEEFLKGLLMPLDFLDSNSDGLPDSMDGINNHMQNIIGKLPIGAVESQIKSINTAGYGASGDMPVIKTNYMGMEMTLMDLNDPFFVNIMADIRALLKAILIVTIIIGVVYSFNVTWKV